MKLHLGCGKRIREGWINIDHIKAPGVDKVVNLNKFPYPFKTNSADEIYTSHCIEHLKDPIKTIEEMSRIIKPNGKVTIVVPHFTASGAFSPLHKTYWNSRVFKFYAKNTEWSSDSLEERKPLFNDLTLYIRFVKGKMLWNHLIERLVNINNLTQLLYENHFCFIFPAHDLIARYIK